jgi:hypothetical protein
MEDSTLYDQNGIITKQRKLSLHENLISNSHTFESLILKLIGPRLVQMLKECFEWEQTTKIIYTYSLSLATIYITGMTDLELNLSKIKGAILNEN